MEQMTLVINMICTWLKSYSEEQCHKKGLMLEQYSNNLLYKEKLNEEESKRP